MVHGEMQDTTIDQLLEKTNKLCDISGINLGGLFDLAKSIDDKYYEETEKLPYEFNILDIVRPNENAHSSILAQLFRYKNTEGEYVLLKSFLKSLKEPISTIEVVKPEISVERYRIDILIQEKGKYAIIFENKIWSAADQQTQIERYIDELKRRQYKDEQIYVLYLPLTDAKTPASNSWGKYKGSSIEQERYQLVSFQSIILPWITQVVEESLIDSKEKSLLQQVKLYKEHLCRIFYPPKEKNDMDERLMNLLKEELKLDTDLSESISLVDTKITQTDRLTRYLKILKVYLHLKDWHDQLQSSKEKVSLSCGEYPHIRVRLQHEGKAFDVLIEYERSLKKLCYGVCKPQEDCNKHPSIETLVGKVWLGDKQGTDWWYCWSYASEGEIFGKFQELLCKVKQALDEEKEDTP